MTSIESAFSDEQFDASSYEVELKRQPDDAALLDRLWAMDRIGPFAVIEREVRNQRNAYFDSPDHALDRAQGNLRWRTLEGSDDAELTYKGPSEVVHGVFRRLEITAVLPASTDPLTIQPTPRPLRLARKIATDLHITELVLDTARRSMELQRGEARIELDLDITTMPGTRFRDIEIEAEIIHGEASDLGDLEVAIGALGHVERSTQGKRARGWSYRESKSL
jgi:inorganic triphosphatase YgiF